MPVCWIFELLLVNIKDIGLYLLEEQLGIVFTIRYNNLSNPIIRQDLFDHFVQINHRAPEINNVAPYDYVELLGEGCFLMLKPVQLDDC